MILTNDQEKGLRVILDRYKNKEKYVTICGYAGVGKSTLVRFAIEAIGIDESKVAYACFTGKAAEVLRKKGNKNAITLHKLLYDFFPRPTGGFIKKPKISLEYDIIVADECSMIPKTMVDMLLKYNVFIIFLGDNFQLPQIDKNDSHDLLDHPHVFLSQIMRQAAESEIIQVTMKIRNGEELSLYNGKEVMILPKAELSEAHMTWADQIIVATNNTRYGINNFMRSLNGFDGLPKDGEKIVIKRNYWDICSEDGDALVNGCIGTLKNPFESFRRIPPSIKTDKKDLPIIIGEFIDENGSSFGNIEFDQDYLLTEKPCIDWQTSYKIGKLKHKIGDIIPKQATYGYSITGHSAQGSQWDKVLVIEEKFPFSKIEHARWLYTCCTRPTSRLVLIKSD